MPRRQFLVTKGRPPAFVAAVVAFSLVVLPSSARAAGRQNPSVGVDMSGIWGGGFIDAIAKDPAQGSLRMLIGGDSSGFSRTPNGGLSWSPSNRGLDDDPEDTIAAIAYRSPPFDRQVLAAYGVGFPNTSGVLRSTDGGASWSKLVPDEGSPTPVFQGHTAAGGAAYQGESSPRATGRLLALDETGGALRHIYAGTFGLGVMRSDDAGRTWTPIALGEGSTNPHCTFTTDPGTAHGCFVTGLALSPLPGEADTLYVSVHGGDPSLCIGDGVCGGVFEVANAACSGDGCADPTTTRVDAISGPDPVNAEEVVFSGRTLLCACGPDGFYVKGPADTGLVQRSDGLAFDLDTGTSYPAVAAHDRLIVLGAYNAACEVVDNRDSCHSVYESLDQGLTWTDLTFGLPVENIDRTVAGTDIQWWEGTQAQSMIGGTQYNVSSIVLTDRSPTTILVAGHSGVWTSTTDHLHWQPAVQGIGATTGNDVVVDPNDPGHVYVGVTDWTVFASADELSAGTVVQTETPLSTPKKTVGFAVTVDLQDVGSGDPSDVYLAAGRSGPNFTGVGEEYVDPDPTIDPWEPGGFVTDGSCDRTTPRPIGVAVGRATQLATPTVFVATDGCGLYRFGSGTWTRIASETGLYTVENFFFNYAPLSFPNSLGRILYALDRKSGELWRTADGGDHWSTSPIYTIPEEERTFATGWMVADPNTTGGFVVWVATGATAGLHELTCSTLCQQTAWIDQVVPDVPNAGPVAIVPCVAPCTSVVYVATEAKEGVPASLYKSTPDGTFCNVTAGSKTYASAANFPVQLAVTPPVDGVVTAYLTTQGAGTIVIHDGSSDTCGAVARPAR
jgi:hypothetical protein